MKDSKENTIVRLLLRREIDKTRRQNSIRRRREGGKIRRATDAILINILVFSEARTLGN